MTSYNQIIIIIISLNHQGISFWSAESKESKGQSRRDECAAAPVPPPANSWRPPGGYRRPRAASNGGTKNEGWEKNSGSEKLTQLCICIFFHWFLIRKVCNHQTYGRLLKKILKTESKTWGNGTLDLSHAKNEQLESWFWCTRHQSHEKNTPSFSIKTDSKIPQTDLKITKQTQNPNICLWFSDMFSLWAKWGDSSKIDGVCCKTCKMERLNRY